MTREEYADLLLPNVKHDYNYYEELYPERNLKEGAMVTRYAPSPTGFIHIGALYTAFICSKMARQSEGVFYLRIEDTDQKRTIDDGVNKIIEDLSKFNIKFDEGFTKDGDKGNYGPYMQSQRKDIYQAYAKKLIIEDKAYPCFCSEEDGKKDRETQESKKERLGYYGKWAKCRNLTMEEAIEKINNGEKYIIRLKSPGDFNKRFTFKDCVKGKSELPENDEDFIIIKSDGLPTYHFAHAIDDHLMHTTHIIRSDEWYPSVPKHTQLFVMLGFKVPKYAHISPLMIEDNGTRRKISKRKDPEAAVSFYHQKGIPNEAIMLYLETVANSNFELWLEQNKDKDPDEFVLDFKKMSTGGTLFDYDKLINISKNYISKLTAEEVYELALQHAKLYDKDFADLLEKYQIVPKILNRNGSISLYIKEGEDISKLLVYIGASNAMLKFEEIRVIKEARNNVNRMVNCEVANLNKTVNAASRQIEAIRKIKNSRKFTNLPEELKEIAELRIKNPDASLIELGNLLKNPIGKSGVNYRLNKLINIAKEL